MDGNNGASLRGPVEPPDGGPLRRGPRREYGARAQRNINAVVKAKQLSGERWWHRNREIIDALDRGLSVREAATLFDRGERQIRVIRERLAELRCRRGAQGRRLTSGGLFAPRLALQLIEPVLELAVVLL